MYLHSHVRKAALSLAWHHPFDPQDISVKTKEILANLMALTNECEDSKITLEGLKQHHFPPVTENFLFHLAAAEQLLRIWYCFHSLRCRRLPACTLAVLYFFLKGYCTPLLLASVCTRSFLSLLQSITMIIDCHVNVAQHILYNHNCFEQ